MKAAPVASDEQYRLVMECRSSGLTDYQWCMEHGIKPGTFYNWVKRLRKKGCPDIPPAARLRTPIRQEVVRLKISEPPAEICRPDAIPGMNIPSREIPAMEVSISGAMLRIPNGTDPLLMEQAIRILRGQIC